MGIFKDFAEIDKKFSWSFLGFVLAIFFGALSIYTSFFQEKTQHLDFEILSKSKVVNINENSPKLKIFYDSINIIKNEQTLSILTIKLQNTGDNDILQSHYDLNEVFGISVENGVVLGNPNLISTSNDYLKKNFSYSKDTISTKKLNFSKLIIEKNEFIVFSLTILHKITSEPKIFPLGKIAGVKQLRIIDNSLNNEKERGALQEIYSTPLKVHFTRLIIYGALLIILIITILMIGEKISTSIKQNRKSRIINQFKVSKNNQLSVLEQYLIRGYQEKETYMLERFFEAMNKSIQEKNLSRLSYAALGEFGFFDRKQIQEILREEGIIDEHNKLTLKGINILETFSAFFNKQALTSQRLL